MSANRRLLALTTGQAAKCCFVTSDTMVNWIKADLLRAQRTAGGQYRILLSDLRAFMCSRGMSTELLDDAPGDRPMCWEFHAVSDAGKPDRFPRPEVRVQMLKAHGERNLVVHAFDLCIPLSRPADSNHVSAGAGLEIHEWQNTV